MSDPHLPLGIFCLKVPQFRGKKTIKVELFDAKRWRFKFSPYKKTTYPKPPIRDLNKEYWPNRFRVRINGSWYGVDGFKYTFYTMPEILDIVGDKFMDLTT